MESFADGAAGAAGGVSAISVFYPLNIVRTCLQTDDPSKPVRGMAAVVKQILEEEGPGGLFKGWWSQVVALGTSNFIYFYTYQSMKAIIQSRTSRKITPLFNLGVGALAGVVNVVLTTPLWMVSTQMAVQASKKKGAGSAVSAGGGQAPYTVRLWDTK